MYIADWLFFFFKQNTAYEMRISDWSSDVCSSDLAAEQADFVVIPVAPRGLVVHSVLQTVKQVQQAGTPFAVILTQVPHQGGEGAEARAGFAAKEIGRASCRERVCQYV